MIRAVTDTNIVVSAFLWGGAPRSILDAARQETIALFTSAVLIAELEDVLSRTKFAKRIADVGSSVDEMLGDYLALARVVRPAEHPTVVRDPDDDHVIACALAAEAEVIVSSDADLQTLGRYRNIDILSPAQMLHRLSATCVWRIGILTQVATISSLARTTRVTTMSTCVISRFC